MLLFCTLLLGASVNISHCGSGLKSMLSPPLLSLQNIFPSPLVLLMFPFKLHSMLCLRVCCQENREGDVIIPILLLRTLKLREFHKLHVVIWPERGGRRTKSVLVGPQRQSYESMGNGWDCAVSIC